MRNRLEGADPGWLALATALPLLWMLSASLMPTGEAMTAKIYSDDGFTPRNTSLAIMNGRR